MKIRLSILAAQASLLCLTQACGSDDGKTPSDSTAAGTVALPVAGSGTSGAPSAGTGSSTAGTGPAATSGSGAAGTGAAGTGAAGTGAAGTGAAGTGVAGAPTPVAGTGAPTAGTGAAGTGAAGTGPVDPRGKCDINSGYPDDRACLLPPDPEVGMQIHVGPSDYKNEAEIAKFILRPGEETSQCWTFHAPNDKEIYYQTFELSGRMGTHHIINTMYRIEMTDGGFAVCADPGIGTNGNIIDNMPGASKPYMARGIVAPENVDVARKIPAKVAAQADMHYFNFGDKPLLREFWMNIFFVKPELVKQEAKQIRAMGGLSWTAFSPIAPGTNMVYKYTCPIMGNGRIMGLLGHYHSHGRKFTASIKRQGGAIEKVFEMYDYQDPANFEYDTVTKNPMFSTNVAGAVSGILEVKTGDTLMWDCHIVNDSDRGLTYTNEVKTGEMCNLWGNSLGIPQINCLVP